ncbi:uncharacterized protein LOC115883520 [Sitophilus oryzae]|uniref:Uncharacterized protein LOC115883520 n=1 Tax=Sitophilus oryzae TaxID=7048 RepID=A0A6J2Y424_SITOR|nr:uncharacterized protein LOC115883520 [Sitophilus oryzae]
MENNPGNSAPEQNQVPDSEDKNSKISEIQLIEQENAVFDTDNATNYNWAIYNDYNNDDDSVKDPDYETDSSSSCGSSCSRSSKSSSSSSGGSSNSNYSLSNLNIKSQTVEGDIRSMVLVNPQPADTQNSTYNQAAEMSVAVTKAADIQVRDASATGSQVIVNQLADAQAADI